MKCLYCGKRLALLRKLTDGEFCSDMHRRLFHQEHEKMALTRLMDAQKRFETLTRTGTETSNGKNGKNGRNGKAAPMNGVPLPQEEMKGFLPYGPVTKSLRGFRQLSVGPLRQMVEPFLPELHLRLEVFPHTAGAVEIAIAQPGPVVFRRPAASFDALAAGPRPELPAWNFRQGAARLAGAGEQGWKWEQPAGFQTPLRVFNCGAELASLPPALPMLAFDPVLNFPEGALDVDPVIEVQILEPATPVLPEEFAPGFSGAISKAFPRGLLIPVEHSVMGVEEVLTFEENPAPAPMTSRLAPLQKPDAAERKRNMRRVRTREMFFPLPRLGDLPALASRVAHGSVPETLLAGATGSEWNPGPVALPFLAGPMDCGAGCGIGAFSFVPAPISERQVLPRLGDIPTIPVRLPEGEAVEAVLATAVTAAPLAPRMRTADDLSALDVATPFEKPRLTGLLRTPSLLISELPERLTGEPVAGTAYGRSRRVAPVTSSTADHVVRPKFPPGALFHPSPNLPASHSMASVALLERDSVLGFIRCQGTPAETPAPRAILPASRFAGEPLPALSRQALPIPSHTPAAHPKSALGQGQASLWPDPARIMPRLQAGIAEDCDVRDAVRAINVVWGGRRKPWMRMPSFALPISRPDLKWFVMSVPVLLLLAVYSLTNSQETAPVASAVPQAEPETAVAEAAPPVSRHVRSHSRKAAEPPPVIAHVPETAVTPASAAPFSGGIEGLKQSILRRAAISLSDDFRSGLGEWEGRGDWSKQWSYDPAGFLVTGPLALYRPSLNLSDYRMEFLGQIEKKSLGWVYRAADTENYYATKITLTTAGPLPQAIIERYAVVNGKQSSHYRRPLPLQIHADTLYRIRVDVRGNGFTLLVQGQVVDYWSDDRLKTGGIGFFSAKGEQARLRWVEVSHQYDFLGRLCAFLAPYSLPAKDGSLKQ
ncbi:MAG: hypothetical protein IT165_31050 [Bryobacterales bacterium]|nr:hypothetical protein [Bryobacterales bacterium]